MRIYVGNLPYETDEVTLKQLFDPYGQVEIVQIIKDHYTGRSRGFGFVQMAYRDDALAAIEALAETVYGGRRLTVAPAKPPGEQ